MSALLMSLIVHVALTLTLAAGGQQAGTGPEPQPTPAGRMSRPERPAPETIRVIAVKYANSRDLAGLVAATGLSGRVSDDSRTNSIVYTGTNDELERVVRLIGELDRPIEKEAAGGFASRSLKLRHRSSDELAATAAAAFQPSDRTMRILSDSARNHIIITGFESGIERAIALIESLDTPTATAQLEFVLFHADLTRRPGGLPLPEDLADVGKELSKLGEYKLLGRLSTVVAEREPFEVEGSIGRELAVEISGMLVQAAEDGVRLRLNARMRLIRPDGGGSDEIAPRSASQPATGRGSDSPIGEFRVQSTLIARVGDTVVVGAAPAGWKPGESAVLVVRVKQ
ncbi:MAG: hypothetical protein HUU22_05715 [Phycisphaerae bacterium]|nr:hypothetical protein [Phycisphaerae bacterium]NUQ45510.1 hypothetical protein [Phycisphaerae bacterium]